MKNEAKKYQVFLSSTYQDLKEERKEVIQALLELDCIPVGMELFPATNEDQWTLIKELIDDCDYYILIIGGRYGSLNKDGISYTQMEYEYAQKIGIPIISFLHENPDSLPVSKTDKNQEKENKLASFRSLAKKKLVKLWNTPSELGSVVSRSLVKLIKNTNRTGWVKADKISSDKANLEILKLKETVNELQQKLDNVSGVHAEDLAQGEDKYNIEYRYTTYTNTRWSEQIFDYDYKTKSIDVSWNNIFGFTSTSLINECTQDEFFKNITQHVSSLIPEDIGIVKNVKNKSLDSILIQFIALGLIEKGTKKRTIHNQASYWKLTQKGHSLLTRLRAIKRKPEIVKPKLSSKK